MIKMCIRDRYVQGVVASEMPSSFEKEALKAQAVASRTYALGRIKAGTKLCDSVHCQVYREDNISRKVKNAVKSTCGQVLLSKGKLAASALYFSSSAGPTENAEDVFTTPHSYLVSVKSSYEPGATHKKETCTLTINSFVKKMRKTLPDAHFGKVTKNNIRIISRTKGGRADTCLLYTSRNSNHGPYGELQPAAEHPSDRNMPGPVLQY